MQNYDSRTDEILNSIAEGITTGNKEKQAGTCEVKWDGKDFAGSFVTSGVYFVKLSSGNFIETKKMIYSK